jgi:phosphate transport system protein
MQPTAHASKEFDADLFALRARVLEAGGIVEYQIRYALEALRTGDRALVARVIADEERVNRLERDIDEACTQLIARRAPAANDLRFIMTIYKAVTDLERIGDEAKKIALAARGMRLNERLTPGYPEIRMAAQVVIDMLRRALDALARLEADDVPEIVRMDREVDGHFQSIVRQLLTYMIEDPRTISPALDLVLVAKSLERIGDHAKNLSEYVVYVIKGRDVRHLPLEEMEKLARA